MSDQRALAKIHIAKKELGLDEDTYRAVLFRVTGKRSAAKMSESQIGSVLEEFKRLGWKPKFTKKSRAKPNSNIAALHYKIEALWASLWHLGLLEGNSARSGLDAYVRRMIQVDALRFVTNPLDAIKLIEGLKDWATRDGGVIWAAIAAPNGKLVDKPKLKVIFAQWRMLHDLGLIESADAAQLILWINNTFTLPTSISLLAFAERDLDLVIGQLGARIRAAKFGRGQ